MNTIVVGLQHGDEGKGKICDYLMKDHDICVRYSGGPNTGASVQVGNVKYKFHHIPVGVIRGKRSYIASACLINPDKLKTEMTELESLLGFPIRPLLTVDPGCHLITNKHINFDIMNESNGEGIGSTRNGIMPCSVDKYNRSGIRAGISDVGCLSNINVSLMLNKHIENGHSILFEGSQGTLLDIDHGFYPYISTSNNTAGAACASAGVGPTLITDVIGVFKPYMTKVGDGPFLTEVDNEWSREIAAKGKEVGTTTGRPRRIGYLDIDLLKQAVNINGCTQLAMTKGDILEGLEFRYMINGCYENPDIGWSMWDEKKAITFIESHIKIPITLISNGPERTQMKERMR